MTGQKLGLKDPNITAIGLIGINIEKIAFMRTEEILEYISKDPPANDLEIFMDSLDYNLTDTVYEKVINNLVEKGLYIKGEEKCSFNEAQDVLMNYFKVINLYNPEYHSKLVVGYIEFYLELFKRNLKPEMYKAILGVFARKKLINLSKKGFILENAVYLNKRLIKIKKELPVDKKF